MLSLNQAERSGLQFLSGWFDIADQVKYIIYKETNDAWSNPEFGWFSWTIGKTEVTLRIRHKIMLKLIKNSWSRQSPVCTPV